MPGALLFVLAALTSAAQAAEPEDPRLVESRALVAEFGGRLLAALTAALEEGGAVSAIAACRDLAPQIASEISRETGASVGRTSRRYRNPVNAPEPWQRDVLETFEAQMADSESGGGIPEHFDTSTGQARYMKAIPLAPLCTVCHGSALAPDVVARLDEDYPFDRARGYEVGQLRGAFTVVWPEG